MQHFLDKFFPSKTHVVVESKPAQPVGYGSVVVEQAASAVESESGYQSFSPPVSDPSSSSGSMSSNDSDGSDDYVKLYKTEEYEKDLEAKGSQLAKEWAALCEKQERECKQELAGLIDNHAPVNLARFKTLLKSMKKNINKKQLFAMMKSEIFTKISTLEQEQAVAGDANTVRNLRAMLALAERADSEKPWFYGNPSFRLLGTGFRHTYDVIYKNDDHLVVLGVMPCQKDIMQLKNEVRSLFSVYDKILVQVVDCQEHGEGLYVNGDAVVKPGFDAVEERMVFSGDKNVFNMVKHVLDDAFFALEYEKFMQMGIKDGTATRADNALSIHVQEFCEFFAGMQQKIAACQEAGQKLAVYYHCFGGVARSATIVMAHLIYICGYSLADACQKVMSKRDTDKHKFEDFREDQRFLLVNFYAKLLIDSLYTAKPMQPSTADLRLLFGSGLLLKRYGDVLADKYPADYNRYAAKFHGREMVEMEREIREAQRLSVMAI